MCGASLTGSYNEDAREENKFRGIGDFKRVARHGLTGWYFRLARVYALDVWEFVKKKVNYVFKFVADMVAL